MWRFGFSAGRTFRPIARSRSFAVRQRHLKAFRELFVQVLQVAREAGLLQLGTLAVDGTKVKASASKHKAMSYGRMNQEKERLESEIAELTSPVWGGPAGR
jgi:transposase